MYKIDICIQKYWNWLQEYRKKNQNLNSNKNIDSYKKWSELIATLKWRNILCREWLYLKKMMIWYFEKSNAFL